jgi:hypothetical protein
VACEALRLPNITAGSSGGDIFGSSGTYGRSPNVTSWGATLVRDHDSSNQKNALYHLFVTEEQDGCGMTSWKSNSAIVHAVSSTPGAGAFRRLGTVIEFGTNPSVHWDDKSKLWRMLILPTGEPASRSKHRCGSGASPGAGRGGKAWKDAGSSGLGNGTNQLYSTPSLSLNWTATKAEFPNCNNPTVGGVFVLLFLGFTSLIFSARFAKEVNDSNVVCFVGCSRQRWHCLSTLPRWDQGLRARVLPVLRRGWLDRASERLASAREHPASWRWGPRRQL